MVRRVKCALLTVDPPVVVLMRYHSATRGGLYELIVGDMVHGTIVNSSARLLSYHSR